MTREFDRRSFIRTGAAMGAGVALGGMMISNASAGALTTAVPKRKTAKPMDVVRIGFIGAGGMGSSHIRNLLRIEGVEFVAVCDIVPAKVKRVQKWCTDAGKKKPAGYSKGEYDYKRMCERDDIDLVYLATPWKWHVPMCVEAMNSGKHAATEVPAAVTIDECWQLVETAEKTGKYCVMMENCNYDRVEMMVLNMVKHGVFGDLLHGQCGYLHGLQGIKFSNSGEGMWRPWHSKNRNGDLYPTHGLGPVAQCMDINRGNQFDHLVSMSSKSVALQEYASKRFGADSKQAKEKWMLGDIVTTMIRTHRGETIIVTHDTNTPRPYSRDFYIQGTKGVARKYPEAKVCIDGRSKGHNWEDLIKTYAAEFEHPVYKEMAEKAKGAAGHGSMDFIEDYRLIQALRQGEEPDVDVYDAAALSAVGELSEISIAKGSTAVDFPDFTRGMWKKERALGVMKVGM